MSLYAVERIEDALQRTKDIVLPFDFMNWTRLAVISIFLGGMGFTNILFNMPFPSEDYGVSGSGAMTGMATAVPVEGMVLAAIGAAIIGGFLVFTYLSATFNFVMFRSLRDREVRIRKNLGRHYIDGLKYFLFQIGVFALMLAVFVGWLASFAASPLIGALMTLPAIPLFILLAIFTGIVHDFAIQRAIEFDESFITSIKEATSTVTDNWKQFGGYLLFRLIISWAIGIMSFFLFITVTVALIIPFAILGVLAAAVAEILALLVGLIGVVTWMVVMLYVNVPFRVYMYSYFVELYDAFTG